ncbi:MAG: helix-turn-helix transcriptional regulator [Eubacterium sp.]|nr:helix-turn-helix transcriptional regulator [Eubacterium sp.]
MGYNSKEVTKLDKKERSKTRLAELRGDRTQEYIAKHTGLTQQSYRNYESGERQANYATLIRLADYFGVTLDYLLDRQSPTISDNRQKLLDKVQALSEENVLLILGVINQLK